MNGDVEELLREGLDRLTADVRISAGLARKAHTHRRRRQIVLRAALAGGTATVAVAAVIAATSSAGTGAGDLQARNTAYVLKNVESALASENLVMRGQATGTYTLSKFPGKTFSDESPTTTWAYGARSRIEEFSQGKPYFDTGTALIGGKLTNVYVAYYDHNWSLDPPPKTHRSSRPANACLLPGGGLGMGAPASIYDWPSFIRAALDCGAARVTGHARIDGVETTVITGLPTKARLPAAYAKTIGATRVRVPWTLYVNPTTYLPVRLTGSTETYGGPAGRSVNTEVTDIQWLPPTAANIAQTLVTIPAGFPQVNPAGQ
jgi:hypothetical protein